MGRGRRGTDWKGVATGAQAEAEERAGWAKAVSEVAMENGSGMAHKDPRPARTPSRDQQPSFFFWFYTPGSRVWAYLVPVIRVTALRLCNVGELYTLHEE